MEPKVTVGMCVKNCAATIRETLESIFNQDFPHELMELIVVDGNSKDETLSTITDYLREKKTEMQIRIFHENKGLGYARQIVVENARGDYIVWVDGDMVLSKDYIKKQVEFMEQNPRVGIAKGKLPLKSLKNTVATLEMFSRAAKIILDCSSKNAHSKALGTSGCIYRAKAIRMAGGFDPHLKGYCEDWDAEIRVRAAGWLLKTIDVEYLDYERYGVSWKELWKKYWLRGYYTHYFLHKHPGLIQHYRMFPPATFLAGLLHAHELFKLSRMKIVFLLPLQYLFKSVAWYMGFLVSHLHHYDRD